MTHTPLQLRRAIDPIMGHNMIEVDMGKDWFALCQVGNVHTNNEEAEQQYGSLADAAFTLFLAAPDLLAALEVCADRLEANRDEWGSVRHKTEVAQARAAIAKATQSD